MSIAETYAGTLVTYVATRLIHCAEVFEEEVDEFQYITRVEWT
jgi:hypothetical protein